MDHYFKFKTESLDEDVIQLIAAHSQYFFNIERGMILKERPLNMDRTDLIYLSKDLNDYVKAINPNATLLSAEVLKSGLTVGNLIDLINRKIA